MYKGAVTCQSHHKGAVQRQTPTRGLLTVISYYILL